MGINYSPKIVTDGLVLCLDAGNLLSYPGTGNTWYDLSGNSNNAILTDNISYNNSGILTLDGINDYVFIDRVPYTSSNLSSFSLCIWVNPLNDTDGNIVSMSNTNPQGAWNMPPISADNQKFSGRIWVGSRLYSNTYQLNSWYYIILVWKYSENSAERGQFFYVNGELIGSEIGGSYSASNAPGGNYLFLGQQNPGADGQGMFSGQISCFQVYGNKALTQQEIQQNYLATKGRFGL
jgi:hypothetical protein